MNKARVMNRAWAAYRTKMRKYAFGKIKTAPNFASCLKWSWKIEKEEGNTIQFKDWYPSNRAFMRRYFSDNSYATYFRTHKGYYELTNASGGLAAENYNDLPYTA